VRLRKAVLDAPSRGRAAKRAKDGVAPVRETAR